MHYVRFSECKYTTSIDCKIIICVYNKTIVHNIIERRKNIGKNKYEFPHTTHSKVIKQFDVFVITPRTSSAIKPGNVSRIVDQTLYGLIR